MVLAFTTTLLNSATAIQTLEADNILYSATNYMLMLMCCVLMGMTSLQIEFID